MVDSTPTATGMSRHRKGFAFPKGQAITRHPIWLEGITILPELHLPDCFVVRTQQHRERWAAENIARAGYLFYLPEVMETVRLMRGGVRRREFQVKPLFPSYIFASAESGQWHGLLRAFGVVGLVPGSGGYPATIKAAALAAISGLEENGVIRLPVIQSGFQPNIPVRITSGAYAGYTGLVQGNSAGERINILLDYMGRKVPFLVRETALELVA